jgi:hypothetical protein
MKKKLVRVTYPLPKAVYGMTVTGRINNKDGSQAGTNSFVPNGNGSIPEVEINRTLKPTDRENATLEAEKGETVITNLAQGGIPEFYTIGGKRHYDGGTPLNLPEDSFIFSRDNKMKIKDPDILAQFGKTLKKKGKKGYTFADLSKPYDINYYRRILADPSSDKFQIDTAEMMIKNYNLKLGGLAMVQESMKGFPNGIPGVAMPYLEDTGMDPSMLFGDEGQQAPQGMPQAQYGGTLPTFPQAQQYLDYYHGEIDQSGNPVTDSLTARNLITSRGSNKDYFDAVRDQQRFDFDYKSTPAVPGTDDAGSDTWSIPQQRTPIVPPAQHTGPTITNIRPGGRTYPGVIGNAGDNDRRDWSMQGNRPVLQMGGGPSVDIDNPEMTSEGLNRSFDVNEVYDTVEGDTPMFTPEMFAGKTDQEINLMRGEQNRIYGFDPGRTEQGEGKNRLVNNQFTNEGFYAAANEYGIPGTNWVQYDENGKQGWRNEFIQQPHPSRPPSTKPFTPGFKYENDKLFQKRQGKVTGEEHWEASNPTMARLYAKKYSEGPVNSSEIQKQIKENPELFASTWGQKAAKDAQLASLDINNENPDFRYGGVPKAQDGLNVPGDEPVSEDQYTTASDFYAEQDPTINEADYTTAPQQQSGLQPGQRVLKTGEIVDQAGNIVGNLRKGTVPNTASRSTKYQNVPSNAALKKKGLAKWDMTAEGYNEANVKKGDWLKKADGKWYQVQGYVPKASAYTGGDLDDRLKGTFGDARESFGRLKQRIDESPELRKALVAEYRKTMAKVKPGSHLSQSDLDEARNLSEDAIVKNFYRAQKQVLAVAAQKGDLKDNKDLWDQDRSHYDKMITEMEFTPMNEMETAAFQGAYIGMRKMKDNPKFKDLLADFTMGHKGKQDEPGGGTGYKDISNVDGIMGNTTIVEGMSYAPTAKEMKLQEAEWSKNETADTKHLRNTRGPARSPFWTEDIANMAFSLKNAFGVKKYTPWNAIPGTKLPNATFMSPDQQIQNILGAANTGARGASAFGSPQGYAANFAGIQNNAMNAVANAIGNVADKNVQVANQFELKRADIMNRANNKRAQLATNLHDKNTILNQQFDNAKTKAWEQVHRTFNNAWTNRGKTQNMNTMTDQYYIDPRTGYKHFYNPRDINAKNAQTPDLAAQINELVGQVPGLTADRAASILAKRKGYQSQSPTGRSGIDPTQTGEGYPTGAPDGYYR